MIDISQPEAGPRVLWVPENEVVQCVGCGEVWGPKRHAGQLDAATDDLLEGDELTPFLPTDLRSTDDTLTIFGRTLDANHVQALAEVVAAWLFGRGPASRKPPQRVPPVFDHRGLLVPAMLALWAELALARKPKQSTVNALRRLFQLGGNRSPYWWRLGDVAAGVARLLETD